MDQAAVGALKKVPLHAARSVRGRGESIDFTAGVTGNGGMWRKNHQMPNPLACPALLAGLGPPSPEVRRNARICPEGSARDVSLLFYETWVCSLFEGLLTQLYTTISSPKHHT